MRLDSSPPGATPNAAAPTLTATAAATTTTTTTKRARGDANANVDVDVDVEELNRHFACPVCGGYFRDATIITECRHTFCKSCLHKHLLEHGACPSCGVFIPINNAWSVVKPDTLLQSLLDKLLPDVREEDERKEAAFYAQRGISRKRAPSTTPQPQTQPPPPTTRATTATTTETDPLDVVSFSLVAANPDDFGRKLDKGFLQAVRRVQIRHVQVFLAEKLGVAKDELTLSCDGKVCSPHDTIEFVARTSWPHLDHNMGSLLLSSSSSLSLAARMRRTDARARRPSIRSACVRPPPPPLVRVTPPVPCPVS